MHLIRLAVRTLGAAALTALVATTLPSLAAHAATTPANAPALDPANFDPTCKPCDDFYQFATGGWQKTHTIPTGRPRWGGFDELAQHNRDELHTILEDIAKNTTAPAGSDEQKLGTFYRACMDTDGIEKAGLTPVQPLLDEVAAVTDVPNLVTTIAKLETAGINAGLPFSAGADTLDSSKQIAGIGFGGLGLPDRNYYLSDTSKYAEYRTAYHAYLAQQFVNLGDAPAAAQSEADAVMGLETTFAKATPDRTELRDPLKTYHPTPVAKLGEIAPHVPWKAYFATYHAPAFDSVDVSLPAFVTAYDTALSSVPLATWKNYLRMRVIDTYAGALPKRFDDASFDFRSGVLLGVKQRLPRWQTCTAATDQSLRDVLGKAYVTRAFPPSAKARAVALVDNLQQTLHDDISTIDWMSPQTKTQAQAKLAAYTKKIGYPDKWVDYSTLQVPQNGSYAALRLAVAQWNDARAVARIGTPTDRTRWGMTPPTVNAYYNPSNNEIVFPAGILGGVFFNPTADDAVNYGAIGAVIGHEMTHGFDDQGRRYDAQGNVRDWWTPADAAAFSKRAQCIIDQFDSYEVLPGVHENGKNVQGEAIADLGGTTIAYKAFMKTPEYKSGKSIGGYTPAQRFFLAYAQVWKSLQTDGYIRQGAAVDPHPNDRLRLIGTLSNMPEFRQAFHCVAGDKMVRANSCQIW